MHATPLADRPTRTLLLHHAAGHVDRPAEFPEETAKNVFLGSLLCYHHSNYF